MILTEAHYNFLKNNEVFLGNVTTTKDIIEYFFHIYNQVTGENRPVTGCGRCVANVKKRLKIEITKYEDYRNRH